MNPSAHGPNRSQGQRERHYRFCLLQRWKTPVGQLRTEEDRRLINVDDIPPQVINAVLATEDNNFYKHIGVDFNGLGRAVKQKLLNEDTQTGGSTLTQQLARHVFLTLDKTDSRKVKEIFLSLAYGALH